MTQVRWRPLRAGLTPQQKEQGPALSWQSSWEEEAAQQKVEVKKQQGDDSPYEGLGRPKRPRPKSPKFPNEPPDNHQLHRERDMTPIPEKASARTSKRKQEQGSRSEHASENEQANLTHGGGDGKAKHERENA